MTQEQRITEYERRFDDWWDDEGEEKALLHVGGIPDSEDMRILCREAWLNGAYVAGENR